MIQLTWAIDLHNLVFLRETKNNLFCHLFPVVCHEFVHAYINSFFHIDSSVQMMVKVWVERDEIFTGGITTDSDSQHPFIRCISEFFHFFFDVFETVRKNSWCGFLRCIKDYWKNITNFRRGSPHDFDSRMTEYLTESNVFGEFTFRMFSYRLN